MKRAALLVVALAAVILVVPSAAAWACSCASLSPREAVAHADVVVRGTVGEAKGAGSVVTYPVEVAAAFKGAPAAMVPVDSPRDGASCGLEVEPGREYVVFAQQRGDQLEASLCGGTAPATPALVAEVEAVTGPGRSVVTPVGPTPVDAPPAAASPRLSADDAAARAAFLTGGAALVAVVAAAVVLWVRRRHLGVGQRTPVRSGSGSGPGSAAD